jgi:hypothetical protein
MPLLRRHWAFALLLGAVAALMLHFVWHPGLASIGDDSVSYVLLARHLAGTAGPELNEWLAYHTNFPPLFPLVLAATGGAGNFLVAHLAVGAFAIAALVALYAFASRELESARAGLLVAALFVLTPTAWISILGVLSESLFLFISIAALHFNAARIAAGRPRARDAVVLGILLGLALLTRAAAVALVAAYAVHASVRMLASRESRRAVLALPLAIAASMAALWMALRPEFRGGSYGLALGTIGGMLLHDPLRLVALGAQGVASGWIASFAAESNVHATARAVFLGVGALGIGGAVLRARRNALDGWYVLLSLAMLFLWFFREDVMRRLLYPLVPILLFHAAVFTRHLATRIGPGRAARWLPFALALPPVVLALPAVALVQSKSLERRAAIAGFPYSPSGITEFYTTVAVEPARAIAARHIAVLAGLEALRMDTPPGAKVMWMRPDYVALLGARQGVPWYYRGGLRGLAEELRRSGAEYLVVSSLYKADIRGEQDDPFEGPQAVAAFAQPVSFVRNAVLGTPEFGLLRVDPTALEAWLAAH